MSEEKETSAQETSGQLKFKGLFAFKMGMTSYITEKGVMEAVTVLRYEPWVVSQIKTVEKDGYAATQLACRPKKAKRTSKSEKNALKAAGFENGAYFKRELREVVDGATVGAKVDINTLAVGDELKVTSTSKGKGFEGVVKRWNMAGGPQTHGSGFHRRPGSSGNRTWPGRVMPGKKFPGHLGDETVTVKSQVIDVIPEENVIVIRGPVPGAKNSLVQLMKV